MATSSSLNVRVVEGRALPAKDVSGSSDPYCLVKVDDEVVARTATVWRSLSPFWGEEYTVHLPLDFHHVAFYVLDEDTVGHDDVIGKIWLSREAITADPRGIDSWINLSRVDPDAEVQGEIRLSVQVLEDGQGRYLRCHVLQARDLAPRDISGTSDPFARVFWGSQSLETSTIKKTRFPHWDEVLELREMPGAPSPLRVELWDWDMVGKNDFLGMVEFSPRTLQQKPPNGWFRLLPFPRAEEDSGGSLGALRLKVRLVEDRVLPSRCYQPLAELLVESVLGLAEEDTASPLAVLEELTLGDCRQDLATKLVKLFLGRGLAGPFLDYLTRREVARTTDPNTLFRSNSLASKSMEQFMKLVGMPYLHEVLKPVVSRVFEEKKYIELDPSKMDLGRASWEVDVGPADVLLPPQDVKYLAISGFLFLRFFAPAILTPKLFDLRDQHADPQTGRSLLLLAKAVQSIGNLGQQLGQGKELWMAPLHPFLLQSISRVRDFLDRLVDVGGDEGPRSLATAPSEVHAQADRHAHAGVPWFTHPPTHSANAYGVPVAWRATLPAPEIGRGLLFPRGRRSRHTRGALGPVRFHAHAPAGCSRTHSAVTLGDWSDPLDPDAEVQMVYRQLLLGRDQLRMKFLEDSTTDPSLEADAEQGACPDVLAQQRAAATRLLEVLADLDRAHEQFQQEPGRAAPGPLGP
ncbi:rasGAP-activating-like protein 1 [Carlito syrichta]|uniref:RasGAP-activating-like protein 1 n=1 Tax=Carlito syrichta TaxID=1868482 RepID=A0A3Q0E029_CARSF|nr:rasGAP-activating-like protein 1 [Carlito syrichta]